MAPLIRHSGRWTPDDRAASRWHYLPFEIAAGCGGLEVCLSYERIAGVLDLGCISPGGWRGWSGGARDRFVITADQATPGYLPGELEAGIWHVVLGLHQVPAAGVGYEVTVTPGLFEVAQPPAAPDRPQRPPRRILPADDDFSWLAGDLHAHTVHSDGAMTVDGLAAVAASRGLDFLAVTDHNTISHHAHLADASARAGIRLMPGQELTTDTGHANAFGDLGWVDFRSPASTWFSIVEERGGLLSINHPIAGDCAWRHAVPQRLGLAEIWHSSWLDRRGGGALAWWAARNFDAVPIGGSDWHGTPGVALPGSPTTWVATSDSDVLGGLRAGRTAVTADPSGPILLRVDDELLALDADATCLVAPDGTRRVVHGDRVRFPAASGPHVLERYDREILALVK
jgi:hypothetical protein